MYNLRDIDDSDLGFAIAPPLAPLLQGEPPAVWMQALGSVAFDLVNPTPDMINFRTIATVLARVPRYAGQTEDGVLSVAQHCSEGAWAVLRDTGRRDWAAAFLLHDAHEYLMGDIATPVAQALGAISNERQGVAWAENVVSDAIKQLKWRLDTAIYAAADITWPLESMCYDVVKVYDLRMCRTERDARLAPSPYAWCDGVERAEPVAGCDLRPWSEERAGREFRRALQEFLPNTLT